jgi:hypothetical protein
MPREEGRYGKGKLGSDQPKEVQRREDRLERIRQASQVLEGEASAAVSLDRAKQAADAEAAAANDKEREKQRLAGKATNVREEANAAKKLMIEESNDASLEPQGLGHPQTDSMHHRGFAHRTDGNPRAEAQRNFTDPGGNIIKPCGKMLQGYNCQEAIDGDHQVIVAMRLSNQHPDVEHLLAMLECTIASAAQAPQTLIVDAGYWSEEQAAGCKERDVDPHSASGILTGWGALQKLLERTNR